MGHGQVERRERSQIFRPLPGMKSENQSDLSPPQGALDVCVRAHLCAYTCAYVHLCVYLCVRVTVGTGVCAAVHTYASMSL